VDVSGDGSSSGGSGTGTGDGTTAKKPKRAVQWADESGKTLREVMMFEVEKIKNTVKDYKSHRDLVKRERQLEKDLHQSKVKEAMHPAVEWRKPGLLILPIDVRYVYCLSSRSCLQSPEFRLVHSLSSLLVFD
jgi:tetrahydromethanopterin S-methyltransferase subunit F